MLYLLFRAFQQIGIVFGPITAQHAFFDTLAQETVHSFSIGGRIAWKLIAEIVEFKLQPRRKLDRVLGGMRNVPKKLDHLVRRTKMTLAVQCKQSAGAIELNMMANGSKQIE